MSAISWYLIVYKGISQVVRQKRSKRFLDFFWSATSLEAVQNELNVHGVREPFGHLTAQSLHAQAHHAKFGAAKLEETGSEQEFLTRTIKKVLDEETTSLENGLTMLATIGATAPFVGLFGTVWGVYHALVAIGMSGSGMLDKVAGPVGEALIMTGIGLAVALPAVMGYNQFPAAARPCRADARRRAGGRRACGRRCACRHRPGRHTGSDAGAGKLHECCLGLAHAPGLAEPSTPFVARRARSSPSSRRSRRARPRARRHPRRAQPTARSTLPRLTPEVATRLAARRVRLSVVGRISCCPIRAATFAAFVGLALIPALAKAQDTPPRTRHAAPHRSDRLPPVTVTAGRGSDLEKLDVSTTVLTRQQVEAMPETGVDQILNRIPGIWTYTIPTGQLHPTGQPVSIRGFGVEHHHQHAGDDGRRADQRPLFPDGRLEPDLEELRSSASR